MSAVRHPGCRDGPQSRGRRGDRQPGPGPAAFPRLSAGHPLASYRALADAPSGNGLELFALVAFIFAVCIFVAGWRHARRPDPGREQ